MIGTIRKHSKWLWWFIAAATVVSFVYWGLAPGTRNRGGGSAGDFGSIYSHKISQQDYINARNEFYLFYWFRNFEWPKNMPPKDLDEQIYLRLLLAQKAKALGIHVSDEEAGTTAGVLLHSEQINRALGLNGQELSLDVFTKQILQPAGLTEADFENFARSDLTIQQLIQALGLTGQLITPQAAQDIYEREHQEIEAQAVFFSASNYLSQITVTLAAVAQFYTNYMAEYRLPDRAQINYVVFDVTNYFSAAEQKIGRTNLNDQVEAIFRQRGMEAVPEAKTPEDAKATIREELVRREALMEADKDANDFATQVFAETPVRPENLAAVAKQKNLAAKTTRPFDLQYGPEEFPASEAFVKAIQALTPDDPFAGPIAEPDGVYVIALDKQLPSEIPPLDQIRERVATDYQMMFAAQLAQRAGTNFTAVADVGLAGGKSFDAICAADGVHPENFPPFSLSTADLPELGNRASIEQIKQTAVTTPVGHASNFVSTQDGGFVLFVQKQLPVDRAVMNGQLPALTAQLRSQRASEVFNNWLQIEANRELRNVPEFQKDAATAGAR